MAHRRNSSLVVSSAASVPLPNTLARRADDDESAKPSATSTATTPSLSSALTASGTASLSTVTVSTVPTFNYNVSDEDAYDECNTPRPTFANSFSNTTTMAHRTVPPPLPLSSSSSSSSISSFALSPSSSPPSSPSSPSSHFLPSGFYNQGPLRHTPNPHRARRSSSSLSSTSTTSPTSPFSATFGSLSGAGPAGAAGMLKQLRAWLNPTSYPPRSTVRRLHASVLARVGGPGLGLGAAVAGAAGPGAQDAYLPMKSPYPYPGQTFHLSRKPSTRADVEKDRKLRNLPPILRRRAQLTVLALVALTLISIVTLFGSGVHLGGDALPKAKAGAPVAWANDAEREAARGRLTNSFRLAHVQPTADASSHDSQQQQQHRPLPPAITLTPAEELAALISFMAALPSNALPSYVDPAQPLDPELVLDFDLRRDKARARSEVRRVVTETWRENPVVVFRTHNALSRRVVSTLEGYNLKPAPTVFDVSARVDAPILKRVLARLLAVPSHAVPGTGSGVEPELMAADPAMSEGDAGGADSVGNGHGIGQRKEEGEGEMEMPLVLVGGKVVVMDGRVVAEFNAEAVEGQAEGQAMDEEERMDAFLASSEMRRLAVSAGARIVEKKKGRKGNKA